MWISADGRANSNAWADPKGVLPPTVLSLVDSLTDEQRDALSAELQVDLFEQIELIDSFAAQTSPELEAEFEREWMPPEAIAGLRSGTSEELILELANLDFRWRLDAYEAVQDYLDSWPD